MNKIRIKSDTFSIQELSTFLGNTSKNEYEIEFDDSENIEVGSLNLEPVTLIATGASILTALISGLWTFLGQKNAGKIIIVGKSGRRLEIPSDTPREQLLELIKLAKELDVENIII
jgi:hypothetical protein